MCARKLFHRFEKLSLILLMATKLTRSMSTASVKKRNKLVFHWFRHGDLRVHDNPALVHSIKLIDGDDTGTIIPIFCFDTNLFGNGSQTPFGTLKVGPKRAKFLLESVSDLRSTLTNSLQAGLAVALGEPSAVFDKILAQIKDEDTLDILIVCQEEVLKEERDSVAAVQSVLKKYRPQTKGVQSIWGSTMYELKDLPFDGNLVNMPDVFTPFRNKVEKYSVIQKPLLTPKKLPFPESGSIVYQAFLGLSSYMPTLKDLGYTDEQISYAESDDPRGVMKFTGGETAALARVQDYIWAKDLLKVYFETRNGMIGGDYSSKFSPWLAHGCLSPRKVVVECKKYEEKVVANKSTYWLVFELLWRDFCKFFCVKHGNSVFFPGGTVGKAKKWSHYEKNFDAWREGRTGYPLVDANMRELKATGFMSNRGRQNVASFLAIDLNHDWRFGA